MEEVGVNSKRQSLRNSETLKGMRLQTNLLTIQNKKNKCQWKDSTSKLSQHLVDRHSSEVDVH